jgi:hypothetical protein
MGGLDTSGQGDGMPIVSLPFVAAIGRYSTHLHSP